MISINSYKLKRKNLNIPNSEIFFSLFLLKGKIMLGSHLNVWNFIHHIWSMMQLPETLRLKVSSRYRKKDMATIWNSDVISRADGLLRLVIVWDCCAGYRVRSLCVTSSRHCADWINVYKMYLFVCTWLGVHKFVCLIV